MELREYLEILNALDRLEVEARKSYMTVEDKEEMGNYLDKLRIKYDLVLVESGNYPTF